MTWLTWRQQQLEALIGGVVIGLVAVVLLWTGHTMNAYYAHNGIAECLANSSTNGTCSTIFNDFVSKFNSLTNLANILIVLPLFIGLVLAAPFVLELEQGTYRLAWTQSITRRRWLAPKLAWMVAATIAVALGLSVLWMWWRGPFDHLDGRFEPGAFDFEGIVPIAYAVFALALCLAVGALLRRIAPAMAITFAVFLGLRFTVEAKLRPHFLTPLRISWLPTDPTPAAAAGLNRLGSGAWILSTTADLPGGAGSRSGAVHGVPAKAVTSIPSVCRSVETDKSALDTCLTAHGFGNSIVYQPASRFWIFQGFESAIFFGLAAVLLGCTVWWVLRRIA